MNEIETIFCQLLGCDRSSLYLDRHRSFLDAKQYGKFEKILKKRISGSPLQYLLGDADFMGLRLRVKPGVLIPRPETEILVDEALNIIRCSGFKKPRILDIGTGCGNIAIAMAKFLKNTSVEALDISKLCLSVAKSNARFHRVTSKIQFRQSDLFDCFKGGMDSFDVIISNPPYIADHDFEALPEDVQKEPISALVAPERGFYFYRKIEEGARQYLKERGFIFLEIGAGQVEGIKNIFTDRSVWEEPHFVKDHNEIERVVIIKKV